MTGTGRIGRVLRAVRTAALLAVVLAAAGTALGVPQRAITQADAAYAAAVDPAQVFVGPVLAPPVAPPTATPAVAAGPGIPVVTPAVGPDAVDGTGIPGAVLTAYRGAEQRLALSAPGCRLSWTLLAGVGRVESGHASGGRVDVAGNTRGPILGPRLDGRPGIAAIGDTDGGALDGDTVWDRAVGSMQFIPSTWRAYAVDGNGDGIVSPHNVFDATLTAGRYLCAGGADLSTPAGQRAALMRYNRSETYGTLVLRWAQAYGSGVAVLPSAPGPVPVTPPTPPELVPPPAPVQAPVLAAAPTPTPGPVVAAPDASAPADPPVPADPAPATAPIPTTPAPTPTPGPTPTPTTPAPTPAPGPTPTPTPPPSSAAAEAAPAPTQRAAVVPVSAAAPATTATAPATSVEAAATPKPTPEVASTTG